MRRDEDKTKAELLTELQECRQLIEQLRESEKRSRDLFEWSPDAIFVESDDGRVLDVNPAACRLHKMPREELIGKHVLDLVPPYLRDAVAEGFEQEVAGTLEYLEGYSWTSDGRAIPIEIRNNNIEYFGKPALLLHVRDITERKQTELALRKARDELEQRVQSRTAELAAANNALQQAHVELEKRVALRSSELAQANVALQLQNDYLGALHETTIGLINHFNLTELLEIITQRVSQLLNSPHVYICLQTHDPLSMEVKVGTGLYAEIVGHQSELGEGLVGEVWKQGEMVLVDEYQHWHGRSNAPYYAEVYSAIGIPLTQSNQNGTQPQVIGVLGASHLMDTRLSFDETAIELLSRFGQLASIAIDNARLFQQVRREKRFFETMVKNSPVAILTMDFDYRIVSWSPSAQVLFGYEEAEVLGTDPHDLLILPDQTETIGYQKVQFGDTIGSIVRCRTKEGQVLDVEMFDVPVVVDGELVAIFAMYHDVTLLQQARRTAELANEAKSAFLASVSHELRTPLTSVLGFAKIIQKRIEQRIFPHIETDDLRILRAMRQVESNLDIIISEGERLTDLINHVLDLAKIEAGKVEWQRKPVEMREVLQQAIKATDSLFAQKELSLIQEIPPSLPTITGDHNRLIQVVINLLSNAVKFTLQGAVTCRVQIQPEQLVVDVIDTGPGIHPDDQPTVFEKFKQLGDTLTDKPHGTGLGLPICREIIEHHGGQIWVDSQLGQGSTFSFSLPLNEV